MCYFSSSFSIFGKTHFNIKKGELQSWLPSVEKITHLISLTSFGGSC
jgi:hypothetical protein